MAFLDDCEVENLPDALKAFELSMKHERIARGQASERVETLQQALRENQDEMFPEETTGPRTLRVLDDDGIPQDVEVERDGS